MAVVGIARVELHVPHAASLKDKRRVVKGLLERIHHRLRVSIAETDFHDLHQRAEIVAAAAATDHSEAEHLLELIRNTLDQSTDCLVTSWFAEVVDVESAYLGTYNDA